MARGGTLYADGTLLPFLLILPGCLSSDSADSVKSQSRKRHCSAVGFYERRRTTADLPESRWSTRGGDAPRVFARRSPNGYGFSLDVDGEIIKTARDRSSSRPYLVEEDVLVRVLVDLSSSFQGGRRSDRNSS